MTEAIKIINISKTYHQRKANDVVALGDIYLSIEEGSFFGLIGPNGAGKSTLIKLITGLSCQDRGTISINGFDTIKQYQIARQMVGVSLQEHSFDPYLTVEEELYLTGGYFGKNKAYLSMKIPEIIKLFVLEDKRKTATDKLSGGMKRRLAIAKALIHEPKILILDEPTAGLDVQLRHELWEILEKLNKQGTTILLTTHYLEEVEHLCDEVAIIDRGKIIHTAKNHKVDLQENSKLEKLFLELVKNDQSDTL